MKKLGLFLFFFCASFFAVAQGLEDIIVERYYVSDANDATDEDGGTLSEGSVTYRIFVDMLPGWEVQAVYGNDDHLLRLETTTEFFNNEDRGEETGDAINDSRLDENTVALDSWVTMGAASDEHFGIPKNLDTDGSIVGGDNNDGGSEGIAGGLLANEDPSAGIPLTNADGLILGQAPSGLVSVGLDLGVFADQNDGPIFTSNGGAWSVLEGVQGVTSDNIVLVAQITTDGDFSFEINVQLGGPNGETVQYVASNPLNDEIFFPGLTFPQAAVLGCIDEEACNFNPSATEDNGSCILPVQDCSVCAGDVLEIIDTDGDGVCDAEEIFGCTSDTACNFNPIATEEDGTCSEPVENCLVCVGGEFTIVDSDGDGICDAEEISGCSSEPSACNYNPDATDEELCLVPIENCVECNANNTGLILIDSDNDGICDAEELDGCTSTEACNFNPNATDDDGSCIEPVEGCQACNASNTGLVIIDSDGDGICDAEDAPCLGDFDGNGSVGLTDLLLFLPEFGCSQDCNYDLNSGGTVDINDLLIFLPLYGSQCE